MGRGLGPGVRREDRRTCLWREGEKGSGISGMKERHKCLTIPKQMNYLRSQQPSSPINMPNGASSHSLSGTPSSQAQAVPGLGGTGGSASTITGATVQAGASGGGGGAITGSDWATRHSPLSTAAGTDTGVGGAAQRPANANAEPIVRPVQQILSSPVDKWGLKALLYEITTQMGKTDRGLLMFGEKLAELGLDVTPEE